MRLISAFLAGTGWPSACGSSVWKHAELKEAGQPGILHRYRFVPAALCLSLTISGVLMSALATLGAHPENYGRLADVRHLSALGAATLVSIALGYAALRAFGEDSILAAAVACAGCATTTIAVISMMSNASDLMFSWLVVAAGGMALLCFPIAVLNDE